MNFLGLYNLFAALAMAGTCSVCGDYPDAAPDYGAAPAYMMADPGGGGDLPPAGYIINAPPSRVDNGYSQEFYWNQPPDQDEEADESDGGDNGDGYGGGYPQAYDAAAAAAAADRAYREAYYGDYASHHPGYDAGGDDGNGYRRHPRATARHQHRAQHNAVARHDRADRQEARSDDPPADTRGDGARQDPVSPRRMVSDDGHGYHGHDRNLFDNTRRPPTPVASGYQVHRHDERDHPYQ